VITFARLARKAVDDVTREGLDLLHRVAPGLGYEIEFAVAS